MKALFAGVSVLGLLLLLLGGVLFLWVKIWHIFGWLLVYTVVILFLAAIPTLFLSKSRVVNEKENSITYNPKEWPLYLNLVVGLGVFGYLYQYLVAQPDLSDGDYNWGMIYLGLNIFSIILTSLKYFANKDDQIILLPEGIRVLDMEGGKDKGFALTWGNISGVIPAVAGSQIVLTARTDKGSRDTYSIKLAQMNIRGQFASIFKDIQNYRSEYGTEPSFKTLKQRMQEKKSIKNTQDDETEQASH